VTQDHRVVIDPPKTDKPVSASAYYYDTDGDFVAPEEYAIQDHFVILKEAEGPVEGETVSNVSIDDELAGIIANYDADALVNFQVYAEGYDPGNVGWVTFTRIFGWMMTGVGLPFLIWGLADDDDFMIPFGAGFTLSGGIPLVISYILPGTSSSKWKLGFEGDAVRRK
jgi:hypothetical protein